MKLNIPAPLRVALYVITLLGTPVVTILVQQQILADWVSILWSAEVAAISALAAFNVPSKDE